MIDLGSYKSTIQNIHNLGWKAQLFNSSDVPTLGHGCGASQYPQFYDIKEKLPCPYKGSYSGEKGHKFLQEQCINELDKWAETFFMVWISNWPTIKYWQNLGTFIDTAKENIPKQCRIGDTCFTLLEIIGGNLFKIHPNNNNDVHKDSNDILSVIIILGTDVCVGEKGF